MLNSKVWVTILLMAVVSSYQDECSRSVRLTVRSSRNQTGHWHTALLWEDIALIAEMDNRELLPVFLDLQQTLKGCSTGQESLHLEALIRVPPHRAGPGYGLYPGLGRYRFSLTPAIWEDARRICFQEGGHLAVIRSKQQQDVFVKIMARHPNISGSTWNGAAWLGVHDRQDENEFLTVLGEPLTELEYINWDTGKPDNKVYGGRTIDSDCVGMLRKGALIDLPCDAKYAYFCEQEV